jgi:hypothetical protein
MTKILNEGDLSPALKTELSKVLSLITNVREEAATGGNSRE